VDRGERKKKKERERGKRFNHLCCIRWLGGVILYSEKGKGGGKEGSYHEWIKRVTQLGLKPGAEGGARLGGDQVYRKSRSEQMI